MKFDQLIEYNMRNIFDENVGETIPRALSKKIKIEHLSGSIV